MTANVSWSDTKARAIHGFNDELPSALTEQAILDAFELEPVAVLHELDAVIAAVRAGKARSGWAVWKSRIATIHTNHDVTVDTEDQPRQIRLAETWIRNTGGAIDRHDELIDELFGPRGRLRAWPDLQPRILAYWQDQRPRHLAAELQAARWQLEQAQLRRRLRHDDEIRDDAQPGARGDEAAAPQGARPNPQAEAIPGPLAQGSDGLALDVQTLAYLDTLERFDEEGVAA